MKSAIGKLDAGKVHKRHLKALARKNTRRSIGRSGLRAGRKVAQQDKRATEHNRRVPMGRWIRRNKVR